MTDRNDLQGSIEAFMAYWQLKRQGVSADSKTAYQLEAAKQKFFDTVPDTLDPEELLKDWEADFADIDARFHHQGG